MVLVMVLVIVAPLALSLPTAAITQTSAKCYMLCVVRARHIDDF